AAAMHGCAARMASTRVGVEMTRWSRSPAAGQFHVQRLSGWSGVLQAERLVKNPGRVLATAFWIFVVLVIVACALELGAWKRTELLHGPFASAGEGSQAYEGRLGVDIWFRALFVPKGDGRNNIVRSNLQMWVNGEVWGPPHAE